MTADDRAAVAMILALPDGPWDFAEGYGTAADYFAAFPDLTPLIEHNERVYARPKTKKQPPRGGECIIK